jgi:hypothetical protein
MTGHRTGGLLIRTFSGMNNAFVKSNIRSE